MEYTLKFFSVCTVDADVDFEHPETACIEADDDAQAIAKGNEHLKSRKSGFVIPYAPKLYRGEQMIAFGDPAHPPTAHHLAHVA